MARRPSDPAGPAQPETSSNGASQRSEQLPPRLDELLKVLDHCLKAQAAADLLGEKFLSYLLAMAIEETRALLRSSVPVVGGAD